MQRTFITAISCLALTSAHTTRHTSGDGTVFKIQYNQNENTISSPELTQDCYKGYEYFWQWDGSVFFKDGTLDGTNIVGDYGSYSDSVCLTVGDDGYITTSTSHTHDIDSECGLWYASEYYPSKSIGGEPVVFLKWRIDVVSDWKCFVQVDNLQCPDSYMEALYEEGSINDKPVPSTTSRFRVVDCDTDNQAEFVLVPDY